METKQIPLKPVCVQDNHPSLTSPCFTLFFLPSTSNTDIEPLRYISSPGGCFHTHFACKRMEFISVWETNLPNKTATQKGKRIKVKFS